MCWLVNLLKGRLQLAVSPCFLFILISWCHAQEKRAEAFLFLEVCYEVVLLTPFTHACTCSASSEKLHGEICEIFFPVNVIISYLCISLGLELAWMYGSVWLSAAFTLLESSPPSLGLQALYSQLMLNLSVPTLTSLWCVPLGKVSNHFHILLLTLDKQTDE